MPRDRATGVCIFESAAVSVDGAAATGRSSLLIKLATDLRSLARQQSVPEHRPVVRHETTEWTIGRSLLVGGGSSATFIDASLSAAVA